MEEREEGPILISFQQNAGFSPAKQVF